MLDVMALMVGALLGASAVGVRSAKERAVAAVVFVLLLAVVYGWWKFSTGIVDGFMVLWVFCGFVIGVVLGVVLGALRGGGDLLIERGGKVAGAVLWWRRYSWVFSLVFCVAFFVWPNGRSGAEKSVEKQGQQVKVETVTPVAENPVVAESCECSAGAVCVGPRGGKYCTTAEGKKRYM